MFNIAVHVEIPLTEVGEGIKVAKFQDPEGNWIALQERCCWPRESSRSRFCDGDGG
ncbi:VOC family protein [Aeromonas dhakensis]|uniref:VOC family protein n=1 Tax=Aeromonas dhakensis TaxID=196024 RepID=UPI0038D20803